MAEMCGPAGLVSAAAPDRCSCLTQCAMLNVSSSDTSKSSKGMW